MKLYFRSHLYAHLADLNCNSTIILADVQLGLFLIRCDLVKAEMGLTIFRLGKKHLHRAEKIGHLF